MAIKSADLPALYKEAAGKKSVFMERMSDNYDLYRGHHWEGVDTKDWQATPQPNWTYAIVDHMLGIVTDNKPGLYVRGDDEMVNVLVNELILRTIRRLDVPFQSLLVGVMEDAISLGVGFWKIFWNKEKYRYKKSRREGGIAGKGGIEILHVDPQSITPDWTATSLADCEFLFMETYRSLGYILKYYPEAKNKLETSDLVLRTDYKIKRRPTFVGKGRLSAMDEEYTRSSTTQFATQQRRFRIIEGWYDFGKKLTTFIGNKVIRAPVDNPYYHGLHPLVKFDGHYGGHEFWSWGAPEPLEATQLVYDVLWGKIMDHLTYAVNQEKVVPQKSGIKQEEAEASYPGKIWRPKDAEQGREIRNLQIAQFPPELIALINFLQLDINVISGIQDVTLGRKPANIAPSGKAIGKLQEAVHTRLRVVVRQMEVALKQALYIMLSLMQQYYNIGDAYRLGGPAAIMPWRAFQGMDIHSNLECMADVDSQLPNSKMAIAQLAMALFREHIINPKELLNYLEFPNRKEIIKRIEAERAAQMQAGVPGQTFKPGQSPGHTPGGQGGGEEPTVSKVSPGAAPRG